MEKEIILKSGVKVHINETSKGVFLIEFYMNRKMIGSGVYPKNPGSGSNNGDTLNNVPPGDLDELNDWMKRNS